MTGVSDEIWPHVRIARQKANTYEDFRNAAGRAVCRGIRRLASIFKKLYKAGSVGERRSKQENGMHQMW
jgi:hypothetical protein